MQAVPTITSYPQGLSLSLVNGGNPEPPPRGRCKGWSDSAAGRNARFLLSINPRACTGYGWALTLTLLDIPPSPEAWRQVVRRWFERMRRAGMLRLHWVMEFQRRGAPHLHVAIWFKGLPPAIAEHWLEVTAEYRAQARSQDVKPIDNLGGWSEYLNKHCARSKDHYQRRAESVPEAWETSGRVWGHLGQWDGVVDDPAIGHPSLCQWQHGRRLVRQYRVAKARAKVQAAAAWLEVAQRDIVVVRAGKKLQAAKRALTGARRAAKRGPAYERAGDARRNSQVKPVREFMSEDLQGLILRAMSVQSCTEDQRHG